MTNYARSERNALCDTLLRVGPGAPTLCSPWTTADLAAHLVIRESRPDLAVGILLPPLKGRLAAAMSTMAAGRWPELVDQVRQGPPRWALTRLGLVDERTNTVEFFVHHEDVLRAEPAFTEPRVLGRGHELALWQAVTVMGRLLARKAPTGVVVVAEGFGRAAVKGPGRRGTVVLRGRPGELLLFLFGRQEVADVAREGAAADLAALRTASLGI